MSAARIIIEYAAAEHDERGGYVPAVWVNGRGGTTWWANGFDKDEAFEMAKDEASDEAGRYIGDWDIIVREYEPAHTDCTKRDVCPGCIDISAARGAK